MIEARRVLFVVLVCALAVCCSFARIPGRPRPRAVQASTAVSVEVLCVDADPFVTSADPFQIYGGHGSGVIVDARHVLTAFHVARCPYLPDVHVVTADGRRYHVLVRREWRREDVALLEIADASSFGPIAPPVIASPATRASICASPSYPMRMWSCGAVDELRDALTDEDLPKMPGTRYGDVSVAMLVVPGNSGAPVYDEVGRLVGLAVEGNSLGIGRIRSLWSLRREVLP
jgi:hypothetical protein